MINKKNENELIDALVEVKVTPQRGLGFDRFAESLIDHPEVDSVYLMSGGFDIMIILSGVTIKDVSYFVSEKIAPLESVISTSTHFILKKFKDRGVKYPSGTPVQERVTIL